MESLMVKRLSILTLMLLYAQLAYSGSIFNNAKLPDLTFSEKKELAQIMLDINNLSATELEKVCNSVSVNSFDADKPNDSSAPLKIAYDKINTSSHIVVKAFVQLMTEQCAPQSKQKSRENRERGSPLKARMNNPEFEHLSGGEKMKIAQLMRKIKELPTEARQPLCNGSLVHYIQSGSYSGDSKDFSGLLFTIDDLSTQALTALESMLSTNTQRCLQESRGDGKIRGENKEKGLFDKIASAWKRLTGSNDKKGHK